MQNYMHETRNVSDIIERERGGERGVEREVEPEYNLQCAVGPNGRLITPVRPTIVPIGRCLMCKKRVISQVTL